MGVFDAALLASVLIITTPILLASLGELVSERAGVLNVGLEGMMLMGAFFGFLAAWQLESRSLGVTVGVLAGVVTATVMAILTIELKTDQIVAGVALNILAIGITTFAFDEILGAGARVTLGSADVVPIPLLSGLGPVGEALFARDAIVYLAFLLIPCLWFLMYRTSWGLAIRSVGEKPVAADASGTSVRRVRWMATLSAGALAGLAGAYLSCVQLGIFRQEMTAGRGFLALAAVILGRWHPVGVTVACLLFGGAEALQLRLQTSAAVPGEVWLLLLLVGTLLVVRALRAPGGPRLGSASTAGVVVAAGCALLITLPEFTLPSQFWLALPALLALVALAVTTSRTHMPTALTIPYHRGER
jgi:simple sugar transport system permease protein